ncbi:MAG: hypothetical protein N2116_05915 [Armatimonadetes bacterium]|nr:hypothetical protein [Armatimonadota bacterium]
MRWKFLALTILSVVSLAWGQEVKDPLQQITQSVEIISGVWFAIGTYFVVAAWVSVISALLPEWVSKKAQVVQTQSARSFLFGLIVVVVLGIFIAVLGEVGKTAPPAGALAVILLLALLTAYSLGWVPVTWVIGRRIASAMSWERADLLVALVGALALHLLVFFPLIGWAVLLYWAIVAVGTWIVRS